MNKTIVILLCYTSIRKEKTNMIDQEINNSKKLINNQYIESSIELIIDNDDLNTFYNQFINSLLDKEYDKTKK